MNTEARNRTLAMLAMTALVIVVATACGTTTGTSGESPQSAADFVRQVTTQFSRGQSGLLWDTLHPADQAVVSRARYMACQSNEGFGLINVQVLQTYADTIDVAGKQTSSTAVSVKVTADDGTTTATMHAIKVNGKWRWILSPAEYVAYAKGKCPVG